MHITTPKRQKRLQKKRSKVTRNVGHKTTTQKIFKENFKNLSAGRMSNEELWKRKNHEPVRKIIRRMKRRWIGHTLHKPQEDLRKQALDWKKGEDQTKHGDEVSCWK